MIYIPLVGFICAGIRCLWAQHQLSMGIMSYDAELVYFDQFNTSLLFTTIPMIGAWIWLKWKILQLKAKHDLR